MSDSSLCRQVISNNGINSADLRRGSCHVRGSVSTTSVILVLRDDGKYEYSLMLYKLNSVRQALGINELNSPRTYLCGSNDHPQAVHADLHVFRQPLQTVE